MTKTNRLFLGLVLVIVGAVSVVGQPAKEKAALTRLLNEFLVGAGTNDAEIHDRFWAADLIYTRSSGTRITKVDLMKGVRSTPKGKTDTPVTTYKAEDVQIRLYGTTAVIAFRLVGTTTKMDGKQDINQFLNTGTFVKRQGRWQAVAWQATAIAKPI